MYGELAQVVERSLSMREVPGSMPGFSKLFFFFILVTVIAYCIRLKRFIPIQIKYTCICLSFITKYFSTQQTHTHTQHTHTHTLIDTCAYILHLLAADLSPVYDGNCWKSYLISQFFHPIPRPPIPALLQHSKDVEERS